MVGEDDQLVGGFLKLVMTPCVLIKANPRSYFVTTIDCPNNVYHLNNIYQQNSFSNVWEQIGSKHEFPFGQLRFTNVPSACHNSAL